MRQLFILLAIIIGVAGHISADSVDTDKTTYKMSFGSIVETGFGRLTQKMEFVDVWYINRELQLATFKLENEYPLNMRSVGGQFSVLKIEEDQTKRMFGVKILADFSDPNDKANETSSLKNIKLSDNESNTVVQSFRITTDIAGRITGRYEGGLFWVIGYHLEHYSFDMIDLDGYWGWPGSRRQDTTINSPVAEYKVIWNMPYLGLKVHSVGESVSFHLMGALGIAIMSDKYDLVQREVRYNSNGVGVGFVGEGDLMYRIPLGSVRKPFKVGLTVLIGAGKVKTKETGVIYGDADPSVEPEDIGLEAIGIPHEVKLSRLSIGLKLEYEL